MKRDWRIRRELLAMAEGQWLSDRAYQYLLAWACPDGAAPPVAAGECAGKERDDACRDLCADVDAAAGARADD